MSISLNNSCFLAPLSLDAPNHHHSFVPLSASRFSGSATLCDLFLPAAIMKALAWSVHIAGLDVTSQSLHTVESNLKSGTL